MHSIYDVNTNSISTSKYYSKATLVNPKSFECKYKKINCLIKGQVINYKI
jgi:hypothetical protein